jgi:hypothetical protein
MYQISFENLFETKKPLLFSVRESPVPLNIPTPTPAPDRGGPVAWVSGPVAEENMAPTQWLAENATNLPGDFPMIFKPDFFQVV